MVEAIAERSDLNKVQAEAALAAFTDIVMREVTGEGTMSSFVALAVPRPVCLFLLVPLPLPPPPNE